MTRLRPAFLLPIMGFLALAGVFGVYLYQIGVGGKNISELPSALIDQPVPDFVLPPIDGPAIGGEGRGFSTADLKGKVSLVNVWASWCPPCRVEHPILMRLAGEGVRIFGINFKDAAPDARAFLTERGNPFTAIGADRSGRVAIQWGVYGYPETFVVDRAGRIRYRHVGPILGRDLDETFYPLLKALAK